MRIAVRHFCVVYLIHILFCDLLMFLVTQIQGKPNVAPDNYLFKYSFKTSLA
jgi:hypothetical protein